MKLFKIAISFIVLFSSCKTCDSFDKISNNIFKINFEKYKQLEDRFTYAGLKLDSLIHFATLSPNAFQIDEYFSHLSSKEVTNIFSEMGFDIVSVTDMYRSYAPKAYLFFPNDEVSKKIKGSCGSRISYSFIYLPVKSDLSYNSYKENIYKFNDHLFLRVMLATL